MIIILKAKGKYTTSSIPCQISQRGSGLREEYGSGLREEYGSGLRAEYGSGLREEYGSDKPMSAHEMYQIKAPSLNI